MLPILSGLILAMLFGLMSFAVYGLEGLTEYAWIDTVFWSLILTGASITLINEVGQCMLCRVRHWLKIARLEKFCNQLTCAK
ncbi:MAG: hypothetical protein KZQ80_05685 [Candidatus Thiodiazotropha sp. (ex Monitilora ramsayi)]|nr:hypothetical protein [Candidatus Thiodiazotropha sp. (ex Monitilora ramsayi)]